MTRLDVSVPTLVTDRMTLRGLALDDAPRIAELSDFDIVRMSLRSPWPYTARDAAAFVDRAMRQDRRRDMTLAMDDGDGLIGVIGFFGAADGSTEVGYWLGRDWWGQGLATEGLKAALGWAADGWSRRAVVSGHFEDNPASGRVLCKAGFVYTGVVETAHSLARGARVRTRRMVWLS